MHSGYAGFRLGALGRFGRWPARWRSALAVVAVSAGRALRGLQRPPLWLLSPLLLCTSMDGAGQFLCRSLLLLRRYCYCYCVLRAAAPELPAS